MGRIAPAPIRHWLSDTPSGMRPRPGDKPVQQFASHPWSAWFEQVHQAVNASAGIVGAVDVKVKEAAITTTAVTTAAPLVAGMYRVSYVVRVTRAATTSSGVQVTVGWTDGVALTRAGAALTGNTTSTYETESFLVRVDAGTTITYAVAYASVGATSMQYSLDVSVEILP